MYELNTVYFLSMVHCLFPLSNLFIYHLFSLQLSQRTISGSLLKFLSKLQVCTLYVVSPYFCLYPMILVLECWVGPWDFIFSIRLWHRLMKNLPFVQILPYYLETLPVTLMMGWVLSFPSWLSLCWSLRGYTLLSDTIVDWKFVAKQTRKRVLINAFTVRALRDTFSPARGAGKALLVFVDLMLSGPVIRQLFS